MKPMRVAKGTVVGNTIVVEPDSALPQGPAVEVFPAEDTDGWDVDEATWKKIDEARAAIRRGEYLTDEQFEAQLAELE